MSIVFGKPQFDSEALAVRSVPKLKIAKCAKAASFGASITHDPSTEYAFRYRGKKHGLLPHVVKFSGGRSSAMLLFVLLENGLLKRERGDVVIFNNTSAEHPHTYEFVRRCMQATHKYGVPFFWVEFQTCEDARKGEWTRLPTYRLVNAHPRSETNPEGFHWKGELYEELLSWTGYVPNQFSRTCTRHLKLDVTRSFLRDWLSSTPEIPRLGHFGDNSRMDPEQSYQQHRKNSGGVPKDIYLEKRAYVWSRPHVRPAQRFDHFCSSWAPFKNEALSGKVFGGKAAFGSEGVEYVAFIGLRGDEPQRIQRVVDRGQGESGYEGEHVYMPLNDMNVSRAAVDTFWSAQDWDLELPKDARLSNCVYCFLKGAANLEAVRQHMSQEVENKKVIGEFGSLRNTPSDLAWWEGIEKKYGRDLQAEGRATKGTTTHIGFFGNHRLSYTELAESHDLGALRETMLPCDCTE